ncbi:ATP-binding protein [Nonomuraea soli]|uniref:Putative ATPase/DNA-binding CsgD family transcriptional regulator n=1 Tax=Nonomuraea soli TaxID=1032476 RepID=A0A7W0CR75_9ACTN|nr:LuxR C-terminal-related transcriptional regulator [Nonomuraea soli]MBA2895757.1 putative ATPase/DNA-binding CsgD family transcriptional regulator [Nonomuraea soli]
MISEREAEVLSALGQRLTNAEIARKFHISVRTVESHVSSLLRKYGVADRRALAALAGEAGTVAPGNEQVVGLPAARSTFIGRLHEQAAVAEACKESRLVTLLGPGGVGKTRLATVVAGSLGYGGAFVDLVPVRPEFVVQAVAAALGVIERSEQPLADAVAERLGSRGSVLVLDNCEHVLDSVAGFADRILSSCPGTRVLATSRERLGVPGERVVPVAPLPLGGEASDAELLFLDRARAADPAFDAGPTVIAEICARLDGVPLAIELAAARSAALGPDGLLAALDDSLRLLSGGRGGDERHRSLRAVLAWSHELLDDEERALFHRLSVFAGAFDLDAVTALTGDRLGAVDGLARLADKSLVARDGQRWRLLETVRAFAWEQLGDERSAVRERHLEWAAGRASALESWPEGWRAGFDDVAADLRAALEVEGHEPARHRLARSLGHLAYARRFLREARDRYRQASELAPSPEEAARDLASAADIALATAAAGDAFTLYLAAADLTGGRDRTIARSRAVTTALRHGGFGFAPGTTSDDLPAIDPAPQDDPAVEAHVAAALAWRSGPENATAKLEHAERAITAALVADDPVLLSGALDALLSARARLGEVRQAYTISEERVDLIERLDRHDPRAGIEIVDAYHSASSYALATGDLPGALSIAHRSSDDDLVGSHQAILLTKLVPPLVLMGEFEQALRHGTVMWDSRAAAGSTPGHWLSMAVYAVALGCSLNDDHELARTWFDRARSLTPSRDLVAFSAFADARIAVHTRRFDQAQELVERGLAEMVPGRFERYARAAAAELAVAAGLPGAGGMLDQATGAGEGNDWAAACLLRARGRLTGDRDVLEASAAAWERIAAHFERERTLELLRT